MGGSVGGQFQNLLAFTMDAHYDSQIKSVVAHTNYSGPARQMGSGGGLGAFAVRMGRVAIPLVRKYVLPVARQVGKNLLETAIPEIGDVLTGKKKPNRKLLASVAKKTAVKTMSKNLPAGVALRPGGGSERKPGAARRVTNGSVGGGERPVSALVNRKRNSSTSISRKTAAKRSRSNILSEIQYSN